jgi:hypothetical protein
MTHEYNSYGYLVLKPEWLREATVPVYNVVAGRTVSITLTKLKRFCFDPAEV